MGNADVYSGNPGDQLGKALVIAAVGMTIAIDRHDPELIDQAADAMQSHVDGLRRVSASWRQRGVRGVTSR